MSKIVSSGAGFYVYQDFIIISNAVTNVPNARLASILAGVQTYPGISNGVYPLSDIPGSTPAVTGTGTGYLVNEPSGLVVGHTGCNVDTGAGTILVGDYITFTGDPTWYRVTTGVTGAGLVNFASTPLMVNLANNTAITIVAGTLANMFGDYGAYTLANYNAAIAGYETDGALNTSQLLAAYTPKVGDGVAGIEGGSGVFSVNSVGAVAYNRAISGLYGSLAVTSVGVSGTQVDVVAIGYDYQNPSGVDTGDHAGWIETKQTVNYSTYAASTPFVFFNYPVDATLVVPIPIPPITLQMAQQQEGVYTPQTRGILAKYDIDPGVSTVRLHFPQGGSRIGVIRPAINNGFCLYEEASVGVPMGIAYVYDGDRRFLISVPVDQMGQYLV